MSKNYGGSREIREIVRQLEDQKLNPGWRVEDSGKHMKAYPPDKRHSVQVMATTTKNWRSLRNMKAELRAKGATLK